MCEGPEMGRGVDCLKCRTCKHLYSLNCELTWQSKSPPSTDGNSDNYYASINNLKSCLHCLFWWLISCLQTMKLNKIAWKYQKHIQASQAHDTVVNALRITRVSGSLGTLWALPVQCLQNKTDSKAAARKLSLTVPSMVSQYSLPEDGSWYPRVRPTFVITVIFAEQS